MDSNHRNVKKVRSASVSLRVTSAFQLQSTGITPEGSKLGEKKIERKKQKKEKEEQEMRISTWRGIWGNYIFKVEQANVFKVDSICKLLGLFLFLSIDVCVQPLLSSLADKAAGFG